MNTEYVIVIEVDNKRAHAAYLKGLDDLDLIWPQIMLKATQLDIKEAEKQLKIDEEERILKEKEDKEDCEYHAAMKLWQQWEPAFFGLNPRPPMPLMPIHTSIYRYRNICRHFYVDSYKSIRLELKQMADLAEAAISPFKMTERKVREMIQWEDGSRIDYIKTFME